MEGLKLVLSGPSGSGKGTIVQELLKDDNFKLSISATTRNKREGEIHGVHYFYKTKIEFEEMIKNNELIEYAHFCDNYYGTPKAFINEVVKEGFDIILEIEVQGALQVKRRYPDAIFIFIMAPTFEELKERLISRNTELPEVVEKRLERAREELLLFKEYDYIVINDSLKDAIEQIRYITKSEKLKSKHYKEHIQSMLEN
ncbi:guanylate kinase [Candidatus Epulonipiscium fishelsonii]|uniref:Guanylate kinase n=1 Tax=Candidatus Epulonipiscium fishelsonii TaxID=77094 RepID=A0ACC8XE78_9FIRM|nr:guanylate kinase [Epulopiscium sp. SCG-B05WGA-EpuloA1]ONI41059.1 guanylate kinase [Epulopiscium sp. SCG-B11WGA-EpuloA1]ONI47937.1 guanylate kinase [Epulopiscium sp. SCG-C06WGA-EpuloA1]